MVGGTRFFDRKEIKDIIAYLSVLHNSADALRLRRIVNEPKRGIGDATVAAAEEIAAMLGIPLFEVFSAADQYAPLSRKAKPLMEFAHTLSSLADVGFEGLVDELLDKTGYRDMLLGRRDPGHARWRTLRN